MKNKLERHYPGDSAWSNFVAAFADGWKDCQSRDDLLGKLDGQLDVAMVIGSRMRDNALAWISQPIPALDGLSPVECTNDPTLILRLRSMLMRMP